MTTAGKIRFVETALDRMERGMYAGATISQVVDTIAWLWKWRKIDYRTMTRLADRATYIITVFKPD